MFAVVLSFVLKLSCHSPYGMAAICVVVALFVGFSWEYAISQSRTQIADWLADPELMLDTAVLLTADVALQIAFCFLCSRKMSGEKLSRSLRVIYQITYWFPGILIFPVLFSFLVQLIFAMPGADFAVTGWTTAIGVLIIMPLLAYIVRLILPETDLRLELLFLVNLLTAALGIVATVNGRTATAGTAQVEWGALAGFLIILLTGALTGLIYSRLRKRPRA